WPRHLTVRHNFLAGQALATWGRASRFSPPFGPDEKSRVMSWDAPPYVYLHKSTWIAARLVYRIAKRRVRRAVFRPMQATLGLSTFFLFFRARFSGSVAIYPWLPAGGTALRRKRQHVDCRRHPSWLVSPGMGSPSRPGCGAGIVRRWSPWKSG